MHPDAGERMELAESTLAEAQELLEEGFLRPAAHAAYYAAFHAAMALLLKDGIRPKTHRGVAAEIGRRFVLPGRMSRETAAALEESFETRMKADYGVSLEVSTAEAEEALIAAREFVDAARKLLS